MTRSKTEEADQENIREQSESNFNEVNQDRERMIMKKK